MTRQLMTREGMEAWLLSEPDPEEVVEHMDYTDWWTERLRNGGGEYTKDIRRLGTSYLKDLATSKRHRQE